ncbi:MAG: sodium-translocating pyrophosphatase, partial [Bacteroidales bacterium]|nr:sodium-translocating pyrophosphatase [Bacteroidales bacterium]
MKKILTILAVLLLPVFTFASEANLPIPDLKQSYFETFGMNGWTLLLIGFIIIFIGMLFGLWQYISIKKIPVHKSMLNVSNTIYETCKVYLLQQGKFLIILFLIIAVAISY